MASEQMEALKGMMKQMMAAGFAPKFDGEADPLQLRQIVEMAQANMPAEPCVRLEPCTIAGIAGERNVPGNMRDEAVIIYIHGGGFLCGNAVTSRGYAGMLAGESGYPVYTLSYRLSPENKYPAALEDCFTFYRGVLEKHPDKAVFLIGESAGATLTIVTALKARDAGLKLPAGIVPYSPLIDLSGLIEREFPGNKDFTINSHGMKWMADLYCDANQDRTDPYVSAYFADLTGLCPMLLAWDESESLSRDSELLRDKAMAAGVEVVWKSYPDCFHAFATTGRGTPESYEILKNTIAFFEKHAG